MSRTKWQNASVQKCKEAWDILSRIYTHTRRLPENRKPKELQGQTVTGLLSYAETVARNNVFWKTVPAIPKPSSRDIRDARRTLKLFGSCRRQFRMPGATDEAVLAKFAQGESRTKLRQKLRRILRESQ